MSLNNLDRIAALSERRRALFELRYDINQGFAINIFGRRIGNIISLDADYPEVRLVLVDYIVQRIISLDKELFALGAEEIS
jgi:hypothetical protein